MKVKFTKAYTTKVGNPVTGIKDSDAEPESFEEGQVVDFADVRRKERLDQGYLEDSPEVRGAAEAGRKSARHFINKGVAVALTPEGGSAPAKPKVHEGTHTHTATTHGGTHTPAPATAKHEPAKKDEPRNK